VARPDKSVVEGVPCSFANNGPAVWNSLPATLRDSSICTVTQKKRQRRASWHARTSRYIHWFKNPLVQKIIFGRNVGLRCITARVQIATPTLPGNCLRQTVHTHCASVHQAAKLAAALLRVAWVTAGLAENNGSLPFSVVHDSRHLQADCQEPGSAPEPYIYAR